MPGLLWAPNRTIGDHHIGRPLFLVLLRRVVVFLINKKEQRLLAEVIVIWGSVALAIFGSKRPFSHYRCDVYFLFFATTHLGGGSLLQESQKTLKRSYDLKNAPKVLVNRAIHRVVLHSGT